MKTWPLVPGHFSMVLPFVLVAHQSFAAFMVEHLQKAEIACKRMIEANPFPGGAICPDSFRPGLHARHCISLCALLRQAPSEAFQARPGADVRSLVEAGNNGWAALFFLPPLLLRSAALIPVWPGELASCGVDAPALIALKPLRLAGQQRSWLQGLSQAPQHICAGGIAETSRVYHGPISGNWPPFIFSDGTKLDRGSTSDTTSGYL